MDGKGVPMPNELIFITADEANYNSNAITDEHGLVQFSIDPTGVTGTSLTVRVSWKRSHQRHEIALEIRLQSRRDKTSE